MPEETPLDDKTLADLSKKSRQLREDAERLLRVAEDLDRLIQESRAPKGKGSIDERRSP
jgi:hypothetical protein